MSLENDKLCIDQEQTFCVENLVTGEVVRTYIDKSEPVGDEDISNSIVSISKWMYENKILTKDKSKSAVLFVSKLLWPSFVVNSLLPKILSPTIKSESVQRGNFGSIFGLSLLTDAYRLEGYPDLNLPEGLHLVTVKTHFTQNI